MSWIVDDNHVLQDKSSFDVKQKQMSEVEDVFTKMKTEEQKDQEAFAAAQKKFQAVSSGLFSNDQDGGEATLQDQLMRKLLPISFIIRLKSFINSYSYFQRPKVLFLAQKLTENKVKCRSNIKKSC